MKALVVANQRGGVGKTTTAVNYAGFLSMKGQKVLLIDVDSQGSAGTCLGVKPSRFLSHFVVNRERLSECVTKVTENLDILPSDRSTQMTEAALQGQMAPEKALKTLLEPESSGRYDMVIIDVAPSVTLLQSCAMVFAGNVLIPVSMDLLSLQGAGMAVETVRLLNEFYRETIRVVGFIPTQVNSRLQITSNVMAALSALSDKTGIPILHSIRVDQAVHKAMSARRFLFDFDPASKAAEDYSAAFEELGLHHLEPAHGEAY